jgi:hypothetical protein
MQDKIYNFILILFFGTLFVYVQNQPPIVLYKTAIYDENDNLLPIYDEMCHSIEFHNV